MSKRFSIASVVLIVATAAALADQTVIPSYSSARDTFFWRQLYPTGNTVYCNQAFTSRTGLNVEHVLPASWMKEAAGCVGQSRRNCRRNSQRFNHMEGDLHNLYPSRPDINQARSNFPFGDVPGENLDFPPCDFEVENRVVEPRPVVRGELARAVLYMVHEYGVQLEPSQLQLMITWHQGDPPDGVEQQRNNDIAAIQGTRNPFIDDPNFQLGGTLPIPDEGEPRVELECSCHCGCQTAQSGLRLEVEMSCSTTASERTCGNRNGQECAFAQDQLGSLAGCREVWVRKE